MWSTLLLCGCAASLSPPPAPPPSISAYQSEAEPPYRSIIAEHLDTMFAQNAEIRSVTVSGLRRVETGLTRDWIVCLRGIVNLAVGGSDSRTYVVLINRRNEIVDRRLAEPGDGCDRERFTPLTRTSR